MQNGHIQELEHSQFVLHVSVNYWVITDKWLQNKSDNLESLLPA